MEMKGVRAVVGGVFDDALIEALVTTGGEAANGTAAHSGDTHRRLEVRRSSDSLELDLDGVDHDALSAIVTTASPNLAVSPTLLCALSCCHSLAVLDGELIGDPLEVELFRATRSTLVDQPELSTIPAVSVPFLSSLSASSFSRQLVRVLHQYEFQSSLQRMTVLCRDEAGRTLVFTKGAPEVVARLCSADSLPHDYTATFSQYARHGYRIIAIAYKELSELSVEDAEAVRPQVESGLTMLGLVLLENKVKPETHSTLSELQAARVRCVMVTGDHVVTALSVANECGLVQAGTRVYQGRLHGEELRWVDAAEESMQLDPLTLRPAAVTAPHKYELAVTGDVFRHLSASPHLSTLFHRVLLSCVIFARMTPDQKALVVRELQALGLYAGFVGDGGNDCLDPKTPVRMANGTSVLARNVRQGDKLLGTAGAEVTVVGRSQFRTEPVMYKITAQSGDSMTVSPGHLVTLAWRRRTRVRVVTATSERNYPYVAVEFWRSDTLQFVQQRQRFHVRGTEDPKDKPGYKKFVVYAKYEHALAAFNDWVQENNRHNGYVNTRLDTANGRIFGETHQTASSRSRSLKSTCFTWCIPGRAWTPEPIEVASADEAIAAVWDWYSGTFDLHSEQDDSAADWEETTTGQPIDSAQDVPLEVENSTDQVVMPTTSETPSPATPTRALLSSPSSAATSSPTTRPSDRTSSSSTSAAAGGDEERTSRPSLFDDDDDDDALNEYMQRAEATTPVLASSSFIAPLVTSARQRSQLNPDSPASPTTPLGALRLSSTPPTLSRTLTSSSASTSTTATTPPRSPHSQSSVQRGVSQFILGFKCPTCGFAPGGTPSAREIMSRRMAIHWSNGVLGYSVEYGRLMVACTAPHIKTSHKTVLPDVLPSAYQHWSVLNPHQDGWRPLEHGDLIEVKAEVLAKPAVLHQLTAVDGHRVGLVIHDVTKQYSAQYSAQPAARPTAPAASPASTAARIVNLQSVTVDPTSNSSVSWQVDGDHRFVLANGILTHNCGALKAAHVGVSLSTTEASIAAPFTYLQPNIRCVPLLLSEGRSALQTSFALFRFIAMYSLIQFSAVLLSYTVGSVLGNWQYLYQDMLVVFVLTLCIGATDANRQLSIKRPSADLLSFANLLTVSVHMALCVAFQVLLFSLVSRQQGYIDYASTNAVGDAATMETTSLYYFSNYQYVIMAALFAMGHPWKRPLYSNLRFTVWCLVLLALNTALLFSSSMAGFWRDDDVSLPSEWRGRLFALVLCHAVVSCLWELVGVHFCVRRWKAWRRSQGEVGWVYGHLKRISGPGVKEYHRLRGEFEQGWGAPDE